MAFTPGSPSSQIAHAEPRRIWMGWSILIAMISVYSLPGVGQQAPETPARPLYPLPRYNEDRSYLSDSSKRNDFWDPAMESNRDTKAVVLSRNSIGKLRGICLRT